MAADIVRVLEICVLIHAYKICSTSCAVCVGIVGRDGALDISYKDR